MGEPYKLFEVCEAIEDARESYSKKPFENMNDTLNSSICAEECSELSQSMMKYVRFLSKDPSLRMHGMVGVREGIDEEVADVLLAIANLLDAQIVNGFAVLQYAKYKIERYEELVNQNKGGIIFEEPDDSRREDAG